MSKAKPNVFEFTHFLTMHQYITKQQLKKSEYSYKREIVQDGGGWKWVLTVKKTKEPVNV